jgi:hypothetical protein
VIAPNEGYLAGLHKRSKLQRLAWAWKGAKKPQERKLNPAEAVNEARTVSETISRKLKQNGIDRKDRAVALVFAEPKNLGKLAGVVVFESPDPHEDSKDLLAVQAHIKHVPIGLVIGVYDRPNKEFIAHARPWVIQAAPLRLLESIVADVANLKDWRAN